MLLELPSKTRLLITLFPQQGNRGDGTQDAAFARIQDDHTPEVYAWDKQDLWIVIQAQEHHHGRTQT